MRTGWLSALMLAALVVATAEPADAQRRRGQGDRERLEQRIRAQMGRVIRERLGLDEEQAQRLTEIVGEHDRLRRELFRQEQGTRRRVEALVRQGATDEVEAAELLERMSELRLREVELAEAEQEALLEVITPGQLLQLQEYRAQIGRRIRALRGGRGGDGDGRRRRGGGSVGGGPAWDGATFGRR